MVKARAWLTLAMISVGTVAATASCGSDEATGGAGGSGALIPPGGSSGTGGGLIGGGTGGTGGTTAVGRAGSSGTGGSSGVTPTVGSLGLPCTGDVQCATGLKCLLPGGTDLGSGGPGDGLCTAACTSDTDCTAFEAGAGCIPFDAQATSGFCLEGCVQGDPVSGMAADKCQGRSDTICVDLSTTSTPDLFCVPWCQADVECGTGMFCDQGSGLCTKTKPTGDPVGAACDPSATTNNCLGACLTTSAMGVTPATGVCVELCSGLTECMYSGTTPGGVCAGLQQNSGLFDLGYCEPKCNCTRFCPIAGDLCQAWGTDAGSVQYKADLKENGFCYPNTLGSTELTCAGVGAGGEAGASN